MGFNSRTREGCDSELFVSWVLRDVSIHAPGRGATRNSLYRGCFVTFQFTHPGGVRPEVVVKLKATYSVSIHAPGRGATPLGSSSPLRSTRFNSRTREGCDFAHAVLRASLRLFQFTHPGGVRRYKLKDGVRDLEFQFTHPGGVRRYSGSPIPRRQTSFQFTHPGGVRLHLYRFTPS